MGHKVCVPRLSALPPLSEGEPTLRGGINQGRIAKSGARMRGK
jgi:hypothetical protein